MLEHLDRFRLPAQTCAISVCVMLSAAAIARAEQPVKPDAELPVASDKYDEEGEVFAVEAGKSLLGKPAPPIVLETIDGKRIDLAQSYGKKPVYLKFWATWCGSCRMQMPHLQKTFTTSGNDMEVIAIDPGLNDSLEKIKAYQRSMGLSMPIVLDDGTAAAAFNFRVTPQHIVIGRDGRILHVGHRVDSKLEHALKDARRPVESDKLFAPETSAPSAKPDKPASIDSGLKIKTLAGGVLDLRDPAAKPTKIVFMSTWCDWYLAETRPQMSENCRAATTFISKLEKTNERWILVISGLWTTAEEAVKFAAEHQIAIPVAFDEDGSIFRRFGIRNVPTRLNIGPHGEIANRQEGEAAIKPE